jgi:PAS domain S-box-containing protein
MLERNFLNQLTVLYVEDDMEVIESIKITVDRVFRKVYIARNGQEALDLFHQLKSKKITVDVIVSDINMPKLNGMDFLKSIRKIDTDIPFFFTTAYSDTEYLLDAIKMGVTDYFLKPINLIELIEKVNNACQKNNHLKKMRKDKKELERYLSAIDNVAIISRTNPKGEITFVNDIFCKVSQYSKEELYGKSHNIVRHPDVPSLLFKDLWETIQQNKTWQGKIKNQAKDGSAYFVNATIIPMVDENDVIREYIGIRFLTTDDEMEKREFKRKVMQNINENKKRELDYINEIKLLKQELTQQNNVVVENALELEKRRSGKLSSQVNYYEKEFKKVRKNKEEVIKFANAKVKEASLATVELKENNSKLQDEVSELKEEIQEKSTLLRKLSDQVDEQKKVIVNLRDVIDHLEDQLNLKKGSSLS